MKVLHINSNFTSTLLHSLLLEKLNNHVENTVYSPIRPNELRLDYSDELDVIESVCIKNSDSLFFRHKSRKMYSDLKKHVDPSEYDLVHAHTLFTDGYIAYKIFKEYGKKYIVAIRNTDVNAFFKYMLQLRHIGLEILNNASRIIFLSPAYKNTVFEKYIPRSMHDKLLEKTDIIPNGIDDFWFDNICSSCCEPPTDNLNLVFVGTIDKNKNIDAVISASDILSESGYNVHLDVAGRESDPQVMKTIKQYPLAKYWGCVDKKKLIEIYRNNHIFVLPSYKETFGIAYAEAMSQALPVIYTKGQGFDGQFPDGEIGYSVSADSAEDIVSAIKNIIGNYETMCCNCVKAVDKFRWSKISDLYIDIYNSIDKDVV